MATGIELFVLAPMSEDLVAEYPGGGGRSAL
jgi:hypothetical protein